MYIKRKVFNAKQILVSDFSENGFFERQNKADRSECFVVHRSAVPEAFDLLHVAGTESSVWKNLLSNPDRHGHVLHVQPQLAEDNVERKDVCKPDRRH